MERYTRRSECQKIVRVRFLWPCTRRVSLVLSVRYPPNRKHWTRTASLAIDKRIAVGNLDHAYRVLATSIPPRSFPRNPFSYNSISWLRHCATSRKVTGLIEVIGFFNWPNPSSRIMALEFTQLLIEVSTKNLSGGKGWPARKPDNLTAICEPTLKKMWEPRHLTNLWASTACYRKLHLYVKTPSITAAVRSKTWTAFTRSNAVVVGSNPTLGMVVSVCLYYPVCR
jgi:hypothetical protein